MADLNFSPSSRQIPIKARLDKYAESRLRPNILTSEGKFSDRPYPAYPYLPVQFQDVTTKDWVAIQKGTIVSALTNATPDPVNNTVSGTYHIGDPDLSGQVYLGLGVDGTMRTSYVDSAYWGYEEYIAGLLVPCNGGSASNLPYSTDDVGQTITVSGAYVTTANVSAGYTLPLAANKPIGVTYQDVYQDIEGRNLNYELHNRSMFGIVHDHVIEIPYVNLRILADTNELEHNHFSGKTFTVGDIATANANDLYSDVWRKHAYAYFTNETTMVPGTWLQSDLYGKFVPFTDVTGSESQLVGKIIVTDTRFPKGSLEYVDTYPGSRVPGTDTGGLPYILFSFVYDLLVAAGATPTINEIVKTVQGGAVGMITINLQVA